MNALWNIITITAIAGVGGTGLGGIVSSFFKKDSSRTVSLLLSFAGGVMTGVVCFDLLTEALFAYGETAAPVPVICGTLAGYIVIYLLNAWIDRQTNPEIPHIDENHPETADALDELHHIDHYYAHEKSGASLFVAGLVMACAIALHNVPEGMVIGAAFAADAANEWARGGVLMAAIIGLHNIPEGMAVAVPLISGGMSKLKAIAITASSGIPTVLGALLGYFLGTMSPAALALALSFASGAMLYVVFGELLPESILMWRSKVPAAAAVVGILTGMLIIYM